MDALEVLMVLNGLKPINFNELQFAVAVRGTKEVPGQGRMAGQIVTLPQESYWPFEKGEIVVVAQDNREPWGEGRSTSKHSVEFKYFTDLAAAIHASNEVLQQ